MEAAPGEPFDNGRFEIVVEPFPDDDVPSISGFSMEDVLALNAQSLSAWPREEIAKFLRHR